MISHLVAHLWLPVLNHICVRRIHTAPASMRSYATGVKEGPPSRPWTMKPITTPLS